MGAVIASGGQGGGGGGGGGGGSGGAAVAPAIAVTYSDVKTTTRIAAGPVDPGDDAPVLELGGDLSAVATQRASTVTKATAQAEGGSSASVGVALALGIADHAVLSRTDRYRRGRRRRVRRPQLLPHETHATASAAAPVKTDNDGETSPVSQGTVADNDPAELRGRGLHRQRRQGIRTGSSNPPRRARTGRSPSPRRSR